MSNILSSKILKKTLIAFVLLLSLFSWAQNKNEQVLSQALTNSSTEMKTSDKHPLEMMKGKIEDVSKRTADAKHYKNTDGSYTALIGAGAIHYKKNGKFLDIDHKITQNPQVDFPLANTTNLMESYFGATAHKGIKSKTTEGEVTEFLNAKMYWEVNGQKLQIQEAANVPVTVQNDKAYYKNIYGNISAEYAVLTGKRKLNYIIPTKQDLGKIPTGADYLVFSEDIILPTGWTHTTTADGILVKDQSGKEMYLYENPYSTDTKNELTRDKNTIFETSTFNNILTIKTKVKTSWLLSNERVFPVMVDPTNDYQANGGRSVYNNGNEANLGYFGYVSGYWLQYHIRFNVSTIPAGSIVTATTGYIYKWGNGGTYAGTPQWHWSMSANPTTTTGTALYNSASSSLSATNGNVPSGGGWLNLAFAAGGPLQYVENGINGTGHVSATVRPTGHYGNANGQNYFAARTHNETDKPYLRITYTVPSNCSGTPTGGTTVLTPNTGTHGESFSGSVTGSSTGGGLTYQWQSAPTASGPWTDISGATNATYNATAPYENGTIYYRRKITCSNGGGVAYSTVVSFTTTCTPKHTTGNQPGGGFGYIGISNVNIGTINNTTAYQNNAPAYNYYSGLSTDISVGTLYPLKVTYKDDGTPYNPGKIGVWIDWNEDGDFNDVNEFIGVQSNVANGVQITFNVNIPSGTTAGVKRLRVRSVYNDEALTSVDACTIKQYGETEDYNLNVVIPIAKPENIKFHNYGGDEQLAFNNSRIDTDKPVFRLSHEEYDATDYEIQISPNPNFSGTPWTQTFTGTYPLNTETNFTFNNAFAPTNDTTYYVRARAQGAANVWSDWTTEAYSFTYQTPKTIPDWFQTTQAQFQSDALSGVTADGNNDVVVQSGGGTNPILNPSFETSGSPAANWSRNGNSWIQAIRDNDYSSEGNQSLAMYIRAADLSGIGYNSSNDNLSIYQNNIDLTNVTELKFELWQWYIWGGGNSTPVSFQVIVDDNSSNGHYSSGTIIYEKIGVNTQEMIYGTQTVDLTSYNFTGNKTIKLVYRVKTTDYSNTNVYIFYIDNLRVTKASKGTITSTPIHLASVQGATAYQGITWNQTLGGGSLTLKVQQSADGISGWTDVAGYTNITETGDGEKTHDLSAMTVYPHIRLVGTLDGAAVKMHDWAVAFVKELPCDKTWTGTVSTDWHTAGNWLPIGVPTNKNCVNIPNVSNKPIVSNLATAFAQSLELQETANLKILSGASISIKNEITNHGDETNFVIEDTGSLVQEENLSNTGTITYNRNTAQAWAKDFIYLGSPVSNAQFSQISNEPGKNFGAFYYWLSTPTPGEAGKWSSAIAGNSVNTMTAAQGYIARIPNNWLAATIYKMNFKGIPNNGDITVPFKTGARQDDVSTGNVNEAYQDKWVLLANPYPSAIDALKMLNLQSNKDLLFDSGNPSNPYNSDGALYFWNHKDGTGAMQNPFYNNGTDYSSDPNNHYIVKNFTGTTPIETTINNSPAGSWNGKIPAAQAFFIRGKENADGHFSFTNSMRVTGENDSYYKNNEKHRFWLDLTKKDNNKSAQTLIGYVDGASNGLDFMYDGLSMDNDLDIYTNILGKNLSIQGRSLPFDSQDIVTLGYTAPQAGAYRIGLFQTEGLFAPHGIQNIYLKDKSNGLTHNLINTPYEFVTDAGRYNDRFEIVYEKATLTTENIQKTQLNILYDDLQKRWLILSPQHKISKIEIYDLSGKLIWIKKDLNTIEFSIPYSQINQKTALIKVHTDNIEVVTKKIINP